MAFLWLNGTNTFLTKHAFWQQGSATNVWNKVKGLFWRAVRRQWFLWRVLRDMGRLMNQTEICAINLQRGSGLLHRLSAILLFWPCWEWWLDPSQAAIDGLALDQDDWVALLFYAHVYSIVCVVVCACACRGSVCTPLALNNSTSVSLHLLILIWIWSSLNHRQHRGALARGPWCRMLFFWTSILDLSHQLKDGDMNVIPVEITIQMALLEQLQCIMNVYTQFNGQKLVYCLLYKL